MRFSWPRPLLCARLLRNRRTSPRSAAQQSGRKLLTGQAAMGDWTGDAPGVRRRITIADLPRPTRAAPRAILRASCHALEVRSSTSRPGSKFEQYAAGFRDPRVLRTSPNGDIFVSESRADQIKVMRDKNGDGKPEQTEIFHRGPAQ